MAKHHLVLVLFGATGDLAYRKLYPALYRLYKKNYLSTRFAIIGTGRREWSQDHFQNVVLDSIDDEIENLEHAVEFTSHFYYQSHDVKDKSQYDDLKNLIDELDDKYKTRGNRLFYVSLAPELFPIITENLYKCGISQTEGESKLIIEKPFGYDFESAQTLQEDLLKYFDEDQIYRIDHYLGKSIVNSFLHFRFTNHLFASLWNKNHIRQVQITLAEEVGVEERGEYYDQSGVSRDMLQNHIMQLLSLVAMERPNLKEEDAIRKEKIKVVENIHFYEDLDEFQDSVVRGQYGPDINDKTVGYRIEENVAKDSLTETYFAAEISLNLPQWEGVPFFVRSGKRMHDKISSVHIEFKQTDSQTPGNRLTMEISPNMTYKLHLNYKSLGYDQSTSVINLNTSDFDDYQDTPADYERLLLEALNGNLESFSHWLELAHAWKFVDHIHDYWSQEKPPIFPNYAAYSNGPSSADRLLNRKGFKWFD